MDRSDQSRHVLFGDLFSMPACAVDSLAMAAVETGATCAVRVLVHRRSLQQRSG